MQPNRFHLCLCVFLTGFLTIRTEMRLVCYYANWSVYRHTNTPILYLDSIDPAMCTHIHVAFALINPITLEIEPSEKHDIHYTDVFNAPLYTRMYQLKRRKSSLKLLVAVGGWTAASEAFNNVIYNETSRAKFIQQTKEFLYEWNFDGIDLDWEFPGDLERGAVNNSREQFNILIQEMHASFQNETRPFLLTAAVTADPKKVDQGYFVPDFCRYLDYVSVMTYDYYGAWDNVTGINAPLYGRNDSDDDSYWKNVNHSIHYWLDKGCPSNKLNLGLAIYGRSFTLADDSNSVTIGADTIGGGLAGPFTKENGTLAYFEICQKIRNLNWTSVFDTDAQAPYAYSGPPMSRDRQWVGYDDLKSITIKVLYAKTMELGGTMIWSLDQDDYTGLFCGQGQFPVTRRIRQLISSKNPLSEQDLLSTTKANRLSTKQKISFVPIQHFTSPSPGPMATSPKANLSSGNTKNRCALLVVVLAVLFSRTK